MLQWPTYPRYFQTRITFKYLFNLVHLDGMQVPMNMAKRLMAVSTGPSPGATTMLNIPFMAASSHDGLDSGMYQKHHIPKQVTFQDAALLSGLQKINKKLKSFDTDLNALRAKEMEDLEDNINHQVYQILEIQTSLEKILDIVLEILKTKTKQ